MALKFDGPSGATPLDLDDLDELDGLIPTHISRRGELDEWEAQNILKAEAWLHGRSTPDVLTPGFARQLHKRMFDETCAVGGDFSHQRKEPRHRA